MPYYSKRNFESSGTTVFVVVSVPVVAVMAEAGRERTPEASRAAYRKPLSKGIACGTATASMKGTSVGSPQQVNELLAKVQLR
jgi:hypothetical protein